MYRSGGTSGPQNKKKTAKNRVFLWATNNHLNFETLVQNSINQLFLFNFHCLKTRYKCLKTRSFVSKSAFHMNISQFLSSSNDRLKPVDNSLLPVDNPVDNFCALQQKHEF